MYCWSDTLNEPDNSPGELEWTEPTRFSPISHFYAPENVRKTYDFLTLLGGIEMWSWTKMG